MLLFAFVIFSTVMIIIIIIIIIIIHFSFINVPV